MLCFTPSRKPPVEVLRQSSYPLNHPTMPRKDPAQFPDRPVVSSQDDGRTQQGTGHADTDRGEGVALPLNMRRGALGDISCP